jgi:RNA polymerase sigma-70 factor (ECF subfamily)
LGLIHFILSRRTALLSPDSDDASSPDADDATDLAIIDSIKRRDRGAWASLYTRHQGRVFAVCMQMVHDRELASDLTQDTFVKLMKGIDSFDGRAKFTTWMTRIAMNVCLSKLRSEKLRRHASLDAPIAPNNDREPRGLGADLEQTSELSHPERVEAKEQKERVLAALRQLDPEQRAVLILADAQGLSYESIAATLGVAVGTVKSRLFRARAALKERTEAGSRRPSVDQTIDRSAPQR